MNKFLSTVSSLATGIVLLTLLTVASLVGVIIPQGLEPESYTAQWGLVAGSMLLSIDADHVFSSYWYNILLGLFSVNIIGCTLKRAGSSLRKILKAGYLTEDKLNALKHHSTHTCSGVSAPALSAEVAGLFKKRGCSVKTTVTSDGILLSAERGSMREAGSLILHLCIIPLIVGGMIAKFFGFSYVETLPEGASAAIKGHPFLVRCDFFTIEKTASGEVRDYKSGLTILDSSGNKLAQKTIEVNHPLVYDGVKFYQSSFANVSGGYDSIKLLITGSKTGSFGRSISVKPGSSTPLPETGLMVTTGDFFPDFFIDRETKTPQTRSPHPENPAIMVTLTNNNDTLFAGWVFEKFGAMHHDDDDLKVSFVNGTAKQATGLLIKKNPGSPAIWFGIIGMSIGVLLVFWVPRRRYRAALNSTDSSKATLTAGSLHPAFDAEAQLEWEAIQRALAEIVSHHAAPGSLPTQP